jgi:charged multivesicular body protein 7
MKAYETSTATLKALLSHPSLQRDHVDNVMESMADTLADHAEIEEAIKLGGESARTAAGVPDVDQAELHKELEGLIELEKQEKDDAAIKERHHIQEQEAREREEQLRQRREEEDRKATANRVSDVQSPMRAVGSTPLASTKQRGPRGGVDADVPEWEKRYAQGQVERKAQRMKDAEVERAKRAKWDETDQARQRQAVAE